MGQEFIDAVKRWERKALRQASQTCRKVAFRLHGSIVEVMPHDTGLAKGNTHLATPGRNNEKVAFLDPTEQGDATKARNMGNISNFKLGDDIWITNNVEYIVPLEFGHSKMAPNGMFRVSRDKILAEWPNIVSEVKATTQ